MLRQSSRSRAVLSGAAVLALAASLAACGSSGGGKGDSAKADATPSATGGVTGTPTGTGTPGGGAPAVAVGKVLMPTGPNASLAKARDTAAGPIFVTTVTGAKSGVSGKVWVWLPPEYNDPKYAKTGFPVLTLFAGGQSNGYNTWTDNQLPIQEENEQLVKEGKAHPFIMIMPVQNFNGDEKNALDCSDIPGQPKMGTWMAEDIPDFVRANFRTVQGRDGWGVMGASTGGFCSAKLALQHPEVYKAAVPIDGYFIPDSLLWKGHDAERAANNPDVLVTQGKADVKMYVTAGGANPYETKVVKSWVGKAVAPTTIEYYEQPGGKHLTSDFKKMIPDTLVWLTKNLAGPAAD
ncbi:alpha/beta hydrolase [Streptomyces sp. 1331.2]|uniref:alpha/beta hydrolase n=1 Tax=Streptomyces sp. 1331.2 TaxID=1938835 RepID=UPI000BD91C48|nr:esterase family protein [Streptomyces sp. 1331.2]SOB84470.1 S-formylglutathione hydrolase FrmB [Streptomyces sp. 1331.2]